MPGPANLCSVAGRALTIRLFGHWPHALAIDREAHARDPVFCNFQFWPARHTRRRQAMARRLLRAYIVGARGKPDRCADPRRVCHAFAYQRHPFGGVCSPHCGFGWLRPQRIEAYLALGVGILVVVLGLWMLWTQRDLLAVAMGEPGAAGGDEHDHAHAESGRIRTRTTTRLPGCTLGTATAGEPPMRIGWISSPQTAPNCPSYWFLASRGLLPDPAALALLLAALASGKVLLGLTTVLVFSLGFAATLVVVGIIAAKIGQRIMQMARQHLDAARTDPDDAAHPRHRCGFEP